MRINHNTIERRQERITFCREHKALCQLISIVWDRYTYKELRDEPNFRLLICLYKQAVGYSSTTAEFDIFTTLIKTYNKYIRGSGKGSR